MPNYEAIVRERYLQAAKLTQPVLSTAQENQAIRQSRLDLYRTLLEGIINLSYLQNKDTKALLSEVPTSYERYAGPLVVATAHLFHASRIIGELLNITSTTGPQQGSIDLTTPTRVKNPITWATPYFIPDKQYLKTGCQLGFVTAICETLDALSQSDKPELSRYILEELPPGAIPVLDKKHYHLPTALNRVYLCLHFTPDIPIPTGKLKVYQPTQ